MRGNAQRESPVLVVLASTGEYDRTIRQLPVRNMMSTPKFHGDLICMTTEKIGLNLACTVFILRYIQRTHISWCRYSVIVND